MPPEPRHRAHAYGLNWASAVPLDQFEPARSGNPVDVAVREIAAIPERTPIASVRAGAVFADGTRFPWHRQASFDMVEGRRIDIVPGPTWSGTLPHAFYGTVVAQLLAWRGLIPMHGCTVEIDGRAVLILGEAGMGKSSLTAGLIAHGATLVSDDLSALAFDPAAGQAYALPGRTTIRLDPAVAEWIEGERLTLPRRDTRGKTVVRPEHRSRAEAVPLAGVIALGLDPAIATSPLVRTGLLTTNLFRPVWMAALPNHAERQRALLALAAGLRIVGFPAVAGGGEAAHAARARAVLELVRAL